MSKQVGSKKADGLLMWVGLGGLLVAFVALSYLLPANRAVPVLTAVLVWVTGWYAWQTQQMARELRAARGVQVVPKLVPSIKRIGGGHLLPRISNAGVGPALDIGVKLAFEPGGPSVQYVSKLLAAGRSQSFMIPSGKANDYVDDPHSFAAFQRLRLTGAYRDALGVTVNVDEVVDLSEYLNAYNAGLWTYGVKKKGGEPLDVIAQGITNMESHIRGMIEAD